MRGPGYATRGRRGRRGLRSLARRGDRAGGQRLLEMGDPVEQRRRRVVQLRPGEPDEGHLQHRTRVGGVAHVDLRVPEGLDRADHPCEAEPGRLVGQALTLAPGGPAELRRERDEERLPEVVDQLGRDLLRPPSRLVQRRDPDERLACVLGGDRPREPHHVGPERFRRPRSHHLVQRRQRVARRAPALADGDGDVVVEEAEAGCGDHVVKEGVQRLCPDEPELEVLGAAPDRGGDLLGVRRRQHEDDVTGRLLQGLQERVGRCVREHVDLVDDVHLPPARGGERRMSDQLPHGVDAVVGRGVELVHVEGAAAGDLHTGDAGAAGLAVDGRRAVERSGQDARRGGLAGAAWPAEEVRVGHPPVAHCALQRPHHVRLPSKLREPPGAEPAVQGDEIGHVLGLRAVVGGS